LTLRAVFFAAPSIFAANALRSWLRLGHEVAGLVHAGRRNSNEPALEWLAPRWSVGAILDRNSIPSRSVSGPGDLKRDLPSGDLVISVGFPYRIPMAWVRTLPRGGVNLHPALLPAFRGPKPIASLCRTGAAERFGGVSLHLLEEEFDAGPLLAQEAVPYRGDFDAWMLELARAHGRLMDPLAGWLAGALEPAPQDETAASYDRTGLPRLTPKLKAEELARICATLGSRRKLKLELDGRRIGIRGYRGKSPRTGAPARIRPLTVSFDAADARCTFSRWLPGTRRWRDARWLLRVALARA
jgi:methionyl-tRNA formyltransferase